MRHWFGQSKSFRSTVIAVLLAVFVLTSFPACKSQNKTSDKDLQLAKFDTVKVLMDDDSMRTVILDVRRPELFQKEHIEGAFNIYMPYLRRRERLLAGDPNIIVYSSGEVDDLLATAACKKLLDLGYSNIYNYRSGLKDWKKKDGSLTSITVQNKKSDVAVKSESIDIKNK